MERVCSRYSVKVGAITPWCIWLTVLKDSINDFLNWFRQNDYVNNDHKVGQMLKCFNVDEIVWSKLCRTSCHQDTRGSLKGCKAFVEIVKCWWITQRSNFLTKADESLSSHSFEIIERRKAFQFRTPTSLLIVGPSGYGKTMFTTHLLLDNATIVATCHGKKASKG